MFSDKLFQSAGPDTEKAHLPQPSLTDTDQLTVGYGSASMVLQDL